MKKDCLIYANDILGAIARIEEFAKGHDAAMFANDDLVASAVVRKLEIIGEAAKSMPDEIRERYGEVQWAEMSKTRDKLIHAYSGVDNEIVWEIVTKDLPKLKMQVKKIIMDREKELEDEKRKAEQQKKPAHSEERK